MSKFKVTIVFLLGLHIGLVSCRKTPGDFKTFDGVITSKQDTLKFTDKLPIKPNVGYLLYINDTMKLAVKTLITGPGTFDKVEKFALKNYVIRKGLQESDNYRSIRVKIALVNENTSVFPPLYYPRIVKPDTTKAPDPATVVYDRIIRVRPGSSLTNLFFYDSSGTITSRQVETALAAASVSGAGKFKIRVINFSDSASTNVYADKKRFDVQMQLQDRSIVNGFEKISYGEVSDYKEFDYGTYQFRFFGFNDNEYYTIGGKSGTDFTRRNYVASYPYQPGGIYSVYVTADSYAIVNETLTGVGILDQVAKIQVVNAAPDYPEVSCILKAGGKTYRKSGLSFGSSSIPLIVPIGTSNVTFDVGGTTLQAQLNTVRLTNNTIYLIEDAKGNLNTFSTQNVISPEDFIPPIPPGQAPGVPGNRELVKVNLYNLVSDLPVAAFSYLSPRTNFEMLMSSRYNSGLSGNYDIFYKSAYSTVITQLATGGQSARYAGNYEQLFATEKGSNVDYVPETLFCHYSYNRKDTLSGKLITQADGLLDSPETCSIVLIGLLNTSDAGKKARLVHVKHTNYLLPSDFIE